MAEKIEPEKFLPLPSAVFHILLVLGDGEQHGYAIMGAVSALTEGQLRMGPGTLYGAIKRMLQDGLIEESEERCDPRANDERRRYYRLTAVGARAASLEAKRLEGLVKAARRKKLFGLKGAH